MKLSTQELADKVDEFGRLCAEIAELQATHKELRQHFVDTGLDVVDGDLFKVTVSVSKPRTTVDTKAIRAKMGDKWMEKFESVGEPTVTVKAAAKSAAILQLRAA